MRKTITVHYSDLAAEQRRIRQAGGFIVQSSPVGLDEYRVTYVEKCRHEDSTWGRCVACGKTWEEQAS